VNAVVDKDPTLQFMSDHHTPQTIERSCDVAVVGGSAAGLAAALQLSRQRRSVIVVDSGEPRNASAAHMHGYLTRDGTPPSELIAAGREEVRSYGGEVLSARVSAVTRMDGVRFRVELGGGHSVVARRVVCATGLVDVLPEIDGLAEGWGRDVIHCPFCHGFEFRDRRVVQIAIHPMGLHTVALLRQLTSRLTVVLHGPVDVRDGELDVLRSGGVDVRYGPVRQIVRDAGGHVAAVKLSDSECIEADVVAVGTSFRVHTDAFGSIGLQAVEHPSGLGNVVEIDDTGETMVAGVFAAGNVTDPSQQVLQAAAHGSRVGAMISLSLADEDLQALVRPSGNEADWDNRYGGEQIWSGNPNGTLVNEIGGMPPGRALDVGAGEGGDALWLAELGWQITASDVSQRALDHIDAEATRRDLAVECHHADANTLDAFETGAFDLVTAQYASIPRTPDRSGVHNIVNAVAPGGTLLIVGHDLEAMHAEIAAQDHVMPFDPDAYVQIDDFAALLSDSHEWEIEVSEKRSRPRGSATSSHHVEDVVLRARRRAN
jgi:thioredoxin reductase/protein-L-isoaspartate O-methyltransferase